MKLDDVAGKLTAEVLAVTPEGALRAGIVRIVEIIEAHPAVETFAAPWANNGAVKRWTPGLTN